MSGFIKTVGLVLVLGAVSLVNPQGAAAILDESEQGDPGGEVPSYYNQLVEFSAVRNEVEESRPKLMEYHVKPGDSLSGIALLFGTDIETLAELNQIANPNRIVAGDIIEILTVSGSVHDVTDGETLASISELYGVEEEVIVVANNLTEDAALERGERVIVPGGTLSRSSYASQSFTWPLRGVLTSGYGWRNGKFHAAIDIAAPLGTPFYASAGGRVTHAGYLGAYGIMVEVDHGAGYLTRYAHAKSLVVDVGMTVSQGQELGYVGVTGNTTGPHVHFELHLHGERLNPLDFLD
jgi:murein DD-endopeptidase MepM/ murein hydrolase activator NlpD